MPSAKVLENKKAQVKDISEKLSKAKAFVVADYRGISVGEDTALRKKLRESGVEYAVVKNTLLSFAAKENGIEIDEHLSGPTAIAISYDDVIAPAKILNEYAKGSEDKYKLKVGYLNGKVISLEEVKNLASIPSKEVLIGRMLGSIQGPLYGLAYALEAIKNKKSEGSVETPVAE